jgi:hypothetical protein
MICLHAQQGALALGDDNYIRARLGKALNSFDDGHQPKRRLDWRDDGQRVRIEGKRHNRISGSCSETTCAFEDLLVTHVNAVEIANRQHGLRERRIKLVEAVNYFHVQSRKTKERHSIAPVPAEFNDAPPFDIAQLDW